MRSLEHAAMKSVAYLFLPLALVTALATAQDEQMFRGRAVETLLVGNTLYVHHPGCTDAEANFILHIAEGGKAYAKERACRLPADRAKSMSGRWGPDGGEFCIREVGAVEKECLTLVKVGDDTYKRVDRTGVRTDWSLAVLKEGNPEGF